MSPDRAQAIRAVDDMPDEELAAIARRIVHDPRVQRAEGFAGWWQRWVGTIAFVTLVLFAAAGLFYVQHVANQTNAALCTFRTDLENRVAQTETFLDRPERFPEFNHPETLALIRAQVQNQRRTILALSSLPCG